MNVDPVLSPPVDAVTDGARRKRDAQQAKRQLDAEEIKVDAEERDLVSRAEREASRVMDGEEEASAAGSAYNPENPYHVSSNFINNPLSEERDFRVGEFFNNYHILFPEATLRAIFLNQDCVFVTPTNNFITAV